MLWRELNRGWAWLATTLIAVAAVTLLASGHLAKPFEHVMHAAGCPATVAELEEAWYPPVPDAENPAHIVLEAAAAYDSRGYDFGYPGSEYFIEECVVAGKEMPPETAAELAEYLEANERAITLLHQIEKPHKARYPEAFLPSYSEDDMYSQLRPLTWMLEAACQDASLRRDDAQFFSALATLEDLAETFRPIPTFSGLMHFWGVRSTVGRSIQYSLSQTGYSHECLETFENLLRELYAGQEGSRMRLSLWEVLITRTQATGDWHRPELRSFYEVHSMMEMPTLLWGRAADIIASDEALRSAVSLHRDVAVGDRDENVFLIESLRGMQAGWLQTILASFGMFDLKDVQGDMLLTALAVERYYIDHQRYPAVIDALVPTYLERLPPDPLEGHRERLAKLVAAFEEAHGREALSSEELSARAGSASKPAPPLKYRLEADRYVIYSAGRDGQDDGGDVTGYDEDGNPKYEDRVMPVRRKDIEAGLREACGHREGGVDHVAT
jgi:hypothetical protein